MAAAVAGVVGYGAVFRINYLNTVGITIDYVLNQFAIRDILQEDSGSRITPIFNDMINSANEITVAYNEVDLCIGDAYAVPVIAANVNIQPVNYVRVLGRPITRPSF
jgi:hypothetical protein